jgi:hypothetical protein
MSHPETDFHLRHHSANSFVRKKKKRKNHEKTKIVSSLDVSSNTLCSEWSSSMSGRRTHFNKEWREKKKKKKNGGGSQNAFIAQHLQTQQQQRLSPLFADA